MADGLRGASVAVADLWWRDEAAWGPVRRWRRPWGPAALCSKAARADAGHRGGAIGARGAPPRGRARGGRR
jgi:hypothetical protein